MGPSILSGPAIWAVLPVKDLAGAKQRLAGVLSATERRELFAAMLEDVLSALAASAGLAGILMVTRDPLAVAVGERYVARSRVVCTSLGVPLYGKLEVLAIDAAARTLTFEVLVDENCGYIGLAPGVPEE